MNKTYPWFRAIVAKTAFLVLAVGITSPSFGAENSKPNPKHFPKLIIKTAGKQEITGSRLTASGNVEISWEEYRVYADHFQYNRDTDEFLAEGRVTMSSKETVISGEKLKFNLEKRTGELYDTYGQLNPTVRYSTDKLTQVDNHTMKFQKLDFTPCSQCVPRWKITCTKGKIKKDDYIEMKNAVFKIKNIPVFYLPYLRYPVNSDGRTGGFLFPRVGHSTIKKFFMSTAFFLPIKPNVDLTLHYDHYADAGNGLAQEFRYLFPHMQGNLQFYYFEYKDQNSLKPGAKSDYYLKVQHKQRLPFLNTRIKAGIDRQSDPTFLRLLSTDFDTALRSIASSTVSIDSSISNVKFSISALENQTYYPDRELLMTKSYLPSLKIRLEHQKIGKLPGYFSFTAAYDIARKEGESFEEGEEGLVSGITSKRLKLTPSYTLKLLKFPWLNASLSLKSRYNYYPQSRNPELSSETNKHVVVEEPLSFNYQSAALNLRGPVFSRVYKSKNGKFKHLIEPAVTLNYASAVSDEDLERIIPVDYADYPAYSFVRFALKTRLLYKSKEGKKSPQEILSYSIKQDYFFNPQLAVRGNTIKVPLPAVLSARSETGEPTEILYDPVYPEFSQLTNTFRVRPVKDAALDVSIIYNHYLKKFTRVRFSLAYKNTQSILYGEFFYDRHIYQYKKIDFKYNRDTIGGSLNIDVPTFPLKLASKVYYDLTVQEWRHGSFRFSFDYQCVRFNVEYKVFKFEDKTDTQFVFGITFGNLGMVKDFLAAKK